MPSKLCLPALIALYSVFDSSDVDFLLWRFDSISGLLIRDVFCGLDRDCFCRLGHPFPANFCGFDRDTLCGLLRLMARHSVWRCKFFARPELIGEGRSVEELVGMKVEDVLYK